MSGALIRQLRAARKHYEVLSASSALHSPVSYLKGRRDSLELMKNRLLSAQSNHVARKKQRYIMAVSKLDAMSPLKVLTRGYALAQTQEGTVLRSVGQVRPGDGITVFVSDGTVLATVDQVKENET